MQRPPSTYKITGHSEENLIKSIKKTEFQKEAAERLRYNETARNQDIQRQLLFLLTNSNVGVWQPASPSTTVSAGRAVSVALPLKATIHLLSVTSVPSFHNHSIFYCTSAMRSNFRFYKLLQTYYTWNPHYLDLWPRLQHSLNLPFLFSHTATGTVIRYAQEVGKKIKVYLYLLFIGLFVFCWSVPSVNGVIYAVNIRNMQLSYIENYRIFPFSIFIHYI